MREEDETLGVSDGISTHGTGTPSRKEAETFDDKSLKANEHDDFAINAVSPDIVDSLSAANELSDIEEVNLRGQSESIIPEKDENKEPVSALKLSPDGTTDTVADSDVELEHELNQLFLGTPRGAKAEQPHGSNEGKPKVGAAKAKRQKRAEKQAAMEAEGKAPPKPRGSRKTYDPSVAIQKARGETATTGRKTVKKK